MSGFVAFGTKTKRATVNNTKCGSACEGGDAVCFVGLDGHCLLLACSAKPDVKPGQVMFD